MPRYYFGCEPRGYVDPDGEDLPNDEAAKRHAALVADELAKGRRGTGPERIVVSNEQGRILYEHLVPSIL